MDGWLLNADWIWLLAPLGVALVIWYRKLDPRLRDGRARLRLVLRGLFLTSIVLALAGLRWPTEGQSVQVVVAADLSASVFDRAVPTQAYKELITVISDRHEAERGLVVFGGNVGLERPLAPVTQLPQPGTVAPARVGVLSAPQDGSLPDFRRPRSKVVRGASDFGEALRVARGMFPSEGSGGAARAIVLMTDGLDTSGKAEATAAALGGSGIDLLCWPIALRVGSDVVLSSIHVPERGQLKRGLPIEVAVEGKPTTEVVVRVIRRQGGQTTPVGKQTVQLPQRAPAWASKTVRFIDHPDRPGVAVYTAVIEESEDRPLDGDFSENNSLHAAVRVEAPSRWAVLAKPGSTLAQWSASNEANVLGVELKRFLPGAFPESEEGFSGFTGVLVDGLSAKELQGDGEALKALAVAVRGVAGESPVSGGIGLVAIGGDAAFGAGRHPEDGLWESLLPITFRPEDDRTRTILFVIDVSQTMDQMMGETRKLDFARGQLGLAVQNLRPTDRLGLITFSGTADVVSPVASSPDREAFVEALRDLDTESNTNFLAALDLVRETLSNDDAEEQLIVLLSDGVQSPAAPQEVLRKSVEAICPAPKKPKTPRRTTLHTFGIGTQDTNEVGERLMRRFAEWGGGRFYPNFAKLAERLRSVFDEHRKDLYVRNDPFRVVRAQAHPVLSPGGEGWPVLPFRNRVRQRGESQVLLWSAPSNTHSADRSSRNPDPILVLGNQGTSRTAVLTLSLDGNPGKAFLGAADGWKGGRTVIASLMSWAEGRRNEAADGLRAEVDVDPEAGVRVVVDARDPESGAPLNGLVLAARLEPLESSGHSSTSKQILPVAPGHYEVTLPLPGGGEGVHRLTVDRAGSPALERFVSIPYPAEYRRFGVDRSFLANLARLAKGRSRMINLPQRDLDEWLRSKEKVRAFQSARPLLLILAMLFLLLEVAARGMRGGRAGQVSKPS